MSKFKPIRLNWAIRINSRQNNPFLYTFYRILVKKTITQNAPFVTPKEKMQNDPLTLHFD